MARLATHSFLLMLAAGVVACAASGDDAESAESQIVSGTPDERPIAARLTREVELTSDVEGQTPTCRAGAGDVKVSMFEGGRYRVELASPCNADDLRSQIGWVEASAVVIDDDAYAGKLTRIRSSASIDVRMNYAGDRIFCTGDSCRINEPLYGMARCYVHPRVAAPLAAAAAQVQRRLPGAKLVMFDCYRPVYVQKRMATLVADPTWVAQPTPPRYGGHNGGIAVDVSIATADGQLLDMGSAFDEFSDRSKYAYPRLSTAQKKNRQVLREAAIAAGLKPYDNEWWHFSLPIDVTPLDLPL